MSKEAKVGLLLGLVLIVGIVLVLRGLHGNDDAKLEEELSISNQIVNSPDSVEQESVDIPTAVDQLSNRSTSVMPPVANNDLDKRYEGDLPGGRLDPTGDMVIPPLSDPLDKTLQGITEQVKTDKSVVEFVLDSHRKTEKPSKRTYIVKKGENLTKIALRVYGKVEGKKYNIIKGIFEANKDKMSSMDVVYPGQKLVIPHLSGEPGGPKMVAINQKTREDKAIVNADAATIYSVQKNDSLWDIAEAKLGSGLRYKEIMALNKLESDAIYEGQTLRLPSK